MPDTLASLLFGTYRRDALSLLLLHPESALHVREIARATGKAPGTMLRELDRLADAGILLRKPMGNQVQFQANGRCPIYEELRSILKKTVGVADVLRAALDPLARRIRAAFVYGSVARGDERGGSDLDLMVVVDVIPSEIAGWADVVLPEATYLERYDELNVEYFREPFVALRQPVVAPPHDQKPNWWIARELALRLGLDDYYPWRDIEEYLDHRLKGAGSSLAELKRLGLIPGPKAPLYFEEGIPPEFATPSGKIEFFSPQLQQAGFDPVPRYTRPADGPPGAFRLLYGRAPVHSFSRTQTNPVLRDAMAENELWINASVGARMGLASGDYVRLRNQDGVASHRVKARVTEAIRPDCVYMVHGFGHTARGLRSAYGKGASDAQLITRYATDPLMGGTGTNVNFVTLETGA